MKPTAKLLALIICAFLFCFTQAKGQTTICFDLNITDNCGTPWGGSYTANVSVYMNDEFQCSRSFPNLGLSATDLTFDCEDLPLEYSEPIYEIKVEVCRTQIPPTCCGHGTSNLIYYSDLIDCYTGIYVTIE